MGCGTAREKLEDQMMVYKLERMEVQMEKEKELKKLAEIEGHTIQRHQIPDYIDPEFAREKRLYPDKLDNKEEDKENKNDDKSQKKRKNSKKNSEGSGDKKKKIKK